MKEYRQDPLISGSSSDWESILREWGLERQSCLSVDGCHVTGWKGGGGEDGFSLVTAGDCSSSMDLAWRFVNDERFPVWASVLATNQYAGRGRSRREWYSPPGNVYASLRLPLLDPAWRVLTHLLAAAGVMNALLDLELPARIKWPNDILVHNKKVGGILIEERREILVAGVGVNICSAPSSAWMREDFAIPAGSLEDFGAHRAPPDLWLRIFHHIRNLIRSTTSQLSPNEFLDYLEPHMASIGDTVVVTTASGETGPATFLGLDTGGGIKVRTCQGEQLLCSGAVYPAFSK